LPAIAQNPVIGGGQLYRTGNAVYLQPDVSGLTGDFYTFNVINNTNQTIPAGTKVYWSLTSTVKSSKIPSAPPPPKQSTFLANGQHDFSGSNPKAWFLK